MSEERRELPRTAHLRLRVRQQQQRRLPRRRLRAVRIQPAVGRALLLWHVRREQLLDG